MKKLIHLELYFLQYWLGILKNRPSDTPLKISKLNKTNTEKEMKTPEAEKVKSGEPVLSIF